MKPAPSDITPFITVLLRLRLELSLLNQGIAREFALNEVDLDCLEVLSREGPTNPSGLMRRGESITEAARSLRVPGTKPVDRPGKRRRQS
jgi:hypothetical protein